MIDTWNHDGGSTPADYFLNVSENGGNFDFNLSVTIGNADLIGFYFNINDEPGDYMGDVFPHNPFGTSNAVLRVTGAFGNVVFDEISVCGYNLTNCGGGNNLNGLPFASWDVGFDIDKSPGSSNRLAAFSIPTLGFTLDDFTSFGVRSQSTGDNQEGSDKAYALVDMPPVEVPEPTSMALMGLGLVGLGLTRRKRKLS